VRGKFLEKYRFNVLKFVHDVTLYPVTFQLDGDLGLELGIERNVQDDFEQVVASPKDLELFVARVLKSERLADVISSLINISK
jgi:hypothetical protein